MAKPFYKVNIEITNVCNLQCSFCPEVVRSKDRMTPELFTRIIDQVAPFTRVVTLHLMGEPLLHPDLKRFVELCHEKSLQIFLVSNGVLLNEAHEEALLHSAFRQISFSLHSFADNFKEKDPTPYLKKIFRFSEKALAENPNLFINYRLWNLENWNAQNPVNIIVLKKIEEYFGVELKESRRIKRHLLVHFDTEFTWPTMDLPVLRETGTCQGLSSHFGILTDGTVVPCCLDKEGNIPLGNIQERPLSDILGSPRAEAIRLGFKNHQLVEELCKRCQYIERFEGPELTRSFPL